MKIDVIEGVGETYASKLIALDIRTVEDLLERCYNPKGRKTVAEESGISEKLILKWTNHSDLIRINGIGPQYAELLEGAGVDTVKELRNRNAENLTKRLAEVNEVRKLSGNAPSLAMVEKWIAEAKTMEPKVTY
jgi:predicted flap endonuclease-1-like 5' DNA nuclease